MLSFRIDPKHSQLHMEMEHLFGVSVLTARITGFSGQLRWDGDSGTLSFDARLDSKTISSALATLDPILVGPAMFHVDAFPEVQLVLPETTATTWPATATGSLTIRGVTQPAAITLLSVREAVNVKGIKIVGVRAEMRARRLAFGMDAQTPRTIGDEVRIALAMEALDEPES